MRPRLEDKHVALDSVKVNGRFRKDLGDLESLKTSIAGRGLLNPITVAPDRTLIAGQRRLEALKQLGWDSVPVRIMDDPTEAHRLEAERDENTCRLDMKPTEKVALGRALEAQEQPQAKAAQGRKGQPRGTVLVNRHNGPIRDRVGAALGMSGSTYARAKKVMEAAEAGDPVAQQAAEEMERTGKIEPAYRKVTGAPPKSKAAVIDITKPRNRQGAEKKKARLAKAIYGLEGTSAGFREVDLRYVLPVTDSVELDEWDRLLGEAVKTLSTFRRDLKRSAT